MVRALLCALLLGCSSPSPVSVADDAGGEVPRAGVYYTEPGTPVPCGWISLPAQEGEAVEDIFVPCGSKMKDQVSDRPEDDDMPHAAPQGWSPPGPPGDPVPW